VRRTSLSKCVWFAVVRSTNERCAFRNMSKISDLQPVGPAMTFLFAGALGSSPKEIGREYSQMLKELSRPKPEGDKFNLAIARAAAAAGLEYWRAFDIWYRKARRIDAHEAAQITEALRIKREKAAQHELQELRIRLAKLESAFIQGHEDFSRSDLDPAGNAVRRTR